MWREWEMKHWQRGQKPRKWTGKADKENRECDGRTVLRNIWNEWVEHGDKLGSWRLLIQKVVIES